ncbi:MAG: hypothetical protein KF784_04770 [Fimbriimonadaceae bacterium]|nr:hypothetical protein [Fimbriimonadaceae bacterium]
MSIGDDLSAAQKAFPAPTDAKEFDSSLSFAMIAPEGWAWMDEANEVSFEAASKDGKIVGLVVTKRKKSDGEPGSFLSKTGEPTRKAEGKTAQMYVWESGDNARFWVTASGGSGIFDIGSMTIIGNKEDLKLLNYRSDDPENFVKQLDLVAEQMKDGSSLVKDAVGDAKKKADAGKK